ncbi:MAG TPA: hypothetical protein DCY13_13630 [Verrucomicrobiales bacterium]|nr:hypothetical protein [Verrucomicrobiales bacterium]
MKTPPPSTQRLPDDYRVWDEDPRWLDAQYRFLLKFFLWCLPIAMVSALFAGSLQPLVFYATVIGVLGLVGVLWLLVAGLLYLLLRLAFWLKDLFFAKPPGGPSSSQV